MMFLDVLGTPLGVLLVTLLGLMVGSFLNVVVYRLPIMMDREEKEWAWQVVHGEGTHHPEVKQEKFNLLTPASHCPDCGHKISAWENIPVLSYVLQGGKCKGCQKKIPLRYMTVEIVTAIASFMVALRFIDPLPLAFALLFTWGLVALIFIDAKCQLLPDRITLPLMWLGILAAVYKGQFIGLTDSVIGAMVGYLSLWSVYWLFKLLTGREGMGYGDFKLLACLCAWQGAMMLPIILVLAAGCGTIYALISRLGKGVPMAFGPFLGVAGWLTFLYGPFFASYLGFFPA